MLYLHEGDLSTSQRGDSQQVMSGEKKAMETTYLREGTSLIENQYTYLSRKSVSVNVEDT